MPRRLWVCACVFVSSVRTCIGVSLTLGGRFLCVCVCGCEGFAWTAVGGGTLTSVDCEGESVLLDAPSSLCRSVNRDWLWIVECKAHRVLQFNPLTGRVLRTIGCGSSERADCVPYLCALDHPTAITPDTRPNKSGNYWICDWNTIRYYDAADRTAETGDPNHPGGYGWVSTWKQTPNPDRPFNCLRGVLCTRAGGALLVSEYGDGCLYVFCTETREMQRSISFERPRQIVYDRKVSATADGDTPTTSTIAFVTTWDGIYRIQTDPGVTVHGQVAIEWEAFKTRNNLLRLETPRFWGIDTTLTGMLIVTCTVTQSLYAIDPINGEVTRLLGTGLAIEPPPSGPLLSDETSLLFARSLIVMDDKHIAFVCDASNDQIRCVTLPPHLFLPSAKH